MSVAKGEAGGFMVMCDALGGRRAYLKPVKLSESASHKRAAREKIVSDLARLIGVSVPPVLLVERDPCPSADERYVCVSRVMCPGQLSWEQMKRYVVDPDSTPDAFKPALAAIPSAAAQGLALDAWVDQVDHNDHPNNIIYGFGGSAIGEFFFLDYAWALGFPLPRWKPAGWANGAWKQDPMPVLFPPHMRRFLDPAALDKIVCAIEQISDLEVARIVGRIPDPYMDQTHRDLIIEGLIGRKPLVRQLLAKELAKGKTR